MGDWIKTKAGLQMAETIIRQFPKIRGDLIEMTDAIKSLTEVLNMVMFQQAEREVRSGKLKREKK